LWVEKRKSRGEVQARDVMEKGIRQHTEDFHVTELRTRTEPSLEQS
jgi:hypothetical protein